MKVRRLLGATAVVSSILGALVAYLVLTVPNDLKAGALLKDARKNLAAGKTAEAHEALAQIVQHHPRTDAAAAATVALVKLGDQERARLEADLKRLRAENETQTRTLNELRKAVDGIRNAPPPKPVEVKPAPAKKPAPKKPVRRTTRRRRR